MWPLLPNLRAPSKNGLNNSFIPGRYDGGPSSRMHQPPAFRGQSWGPRPNSNFAINPAQCMNNPRGQGPMFNDRHPCTPRPRFHQFDGPSWTGAGSPNMNRCPFPSGRPPCHIGAHQNGRGSVGGGWGNPPQNAHSNQKFQRNGPQFNSGNRPNNSFPGNHHQNMSQQGFKKKKKKQKPSKRDLPENNLFFCDACDRGFKTEEKYNEHVEGHLKCEVAGCTYIAAPKLVQLHYRLQHTSGLAKKIWSLDSKEDIEKWRAERRKNYPTASNLEKKKQIQAEKEARGEVIENKYFGKMRGRSGRNQGEGGNFNKRRNRRSRKRRHDDFEDQDVNSESSSMKKSRTGDAELLSEDINSTSNLGKSESSTTDPLAFLLDGIMSGSDTDDEDLFLSSLSALTSASSVKKDVPGTVSAAGGLGSLIAAYNDSTNGKEADTENDAFDSNNKESCSKVENEDSKTGTWEKNQHKKGNKGGHENKRGKQKGNGRQMNEGNSLDRKKTDLFYRADPSLLEKLLANEIRQERNKILQCVHYIVKKNFFGVGSRSNSPKVLTRESNTNENNKEAQESDLPDKETVENEATDKRNVVDDEIWEDAS
ncbi:hypothetical protein CHS0354_005497 [Potamilus streckersoni]|uniref:C2H2-type domain-containing protein n=1 Tax=Potamilus streckersoni TaxID=2493646 RepID=A0AAE0SVP2_9BIVA|nr:hypothetical protein CHS0354_005497 [Potamilus streckersoni]